MIGSNLLAREADVEEGDIETVGENGDGDKMNEFLGGLSMLCAGGRVFIEEIANSCSTATSLP
jgi:hypothetical protein